MRCSTASSVLKLLHIFWSIFGFSEDSDDLSELLFLFFPLRSRFNVFSVLLQAVLKWYLYFFPEEAYVTGKLKDKIME